MITIDDREVDRGTPSLELQPLIESLGVKTHLERLEFGDYSFTGNGPAGAGLALIGVERKRVKDLLSSMRTSRLHGLQIPGMVPRYDFSYLIVEGVVRRNPENGLLEQPHRNGQWYPVELGSSRFMWQDFDHFLTSTEMTSVKVRRTGSPHQSAEVLVSLWHYFNDKLWEEHKSWKVIYTPPDPVIAMGEVPLVRRWAKELEGVGYEKSLVVADRFKTGWMLAHAELGNWLNPKIKGIGETIAKRAVKAIRGED